MANPSYIEKMFFILDNPLILSKCISYVDKKNFLLEDYFRKGFSDSVGSHPIYCNKYVFIRDLAHSFQPVLISSPFTIDSIQLNDQEVSFEPDLDFHYVDQYVYRLKKSPKIPSQSLSFDLELQPDTRMIGQFAKVYGFYLSKDQGL